MTMKVTHRDQIWDDFREAVNTAPAELEKWLKTDESKSLGWSGDGGGETVGHHRVAGSSIIKMKKKADLTDDDFAHMRRIVGYVHRHIAQAGPEKDRRTSPWRYSLMHWGHDPLR